jgi:hypothetical protein
MTVNVNRLHKVLRSVSNADDFMAGVRYVLGGDTGYLRLEDEQTAQEIETEARRCVKAVPGA